jgi:hypothetical protein
MAEIEKPNNFFGEASSVATLLDNLTRWQDKHPVDARDPHRRVWYRGHTNHAYRLWPGVYRDDFTRSSHSFYGGGQEKKRLNLEREMLSDFRTSGATLVNANSIVDVYFMAQHYGMPTRLLDWTTNPLTALFFAVQESSPLDGELVIMDAHMLVPKEPDVPKSIVTMRHPYAVDAIGISFWHDPKQPRKPLVLPIRPDNQYGRIGLQSSCFTLHMHLSGPCKNESLERVKIPQAAKAGIFEELTKLNVNQFTTYNDLDHLAGHIKHTWLAH